MCYSTQTAVLLPWLAQVIKAKSIDDLYVPPNEVSPELIEVENKLAAALEIIFPEPLRKDLENIKAGYLNRQRALQGRQIAFLLREHYRVRNTTLDQYTLRTQLDQLQLGEDNL